MILLAIIWQTGYTHGPRGPRDLRLPAVLRNTMIGIEQVDGAIRESARGMGMTPVQVLARIELPSPCPILAGLRTALVFCVGVATIATFINAGGLGDMIVNASSCSATPCSSPAPCSWPASLCSSTGSPASPKTCSPPRASEPHRPCITHRTHHP